MQAEGSTGVRRDLPPARNGDTTLSIIIVNWNSRDYLRRCLTSLSEYSPQVDAEVIVVDDASHDGCEEMLAGEFPAVVFIQAETNLGFAKANNLGVRRASGRFLFFLNPDTEFLENSIDPLLQRLVTLPDAGAVGCRLLNSDRSLQASVHSFPTPLNRALDSEFLRRLFPRSHLFGAAALQSDSGRASKVDAVGGAAILMTRALFEKIGGFSEIYFMYAEDLDLCFQIHKAGLSVYYVSDTCIIHHGGRSSQKTASNFSSVLMPESTFRFLRCNRSAAAAVFYRAAMGMNAAVRLVLIFPLLAAGGNRAGQHRRDSWQKWKAILRWSCGLERWVHEFPAAGAPRDTVFSGRRHAG